LEETARREAMRMGGQKSFWGWGRKGRAGRQARVRRRWVLRMMERGEWPRLVRDFWRALARGLERMRRRRGSIARWECSRWGRVGGREPADPIVAPRRVGLRRM
jgi:hypothetical protein